MKRPELQPESGAATVVPSTVSTLIDYRTYRLDNGMDVILHHDNKAPIVHVLVWYHVGSKNESMDRTGFAHLFEHMMFQGSEHVGKAEHFMHVQGVGGTLNASTGQDRTDYFQTVPSEYLGLGLWLEADRMRSLKVTEENLQNQLSVVKEERKQTYDNRPYGLWHLTMLEMLFGGSSYSWAPIGDMAHLDAAPLDEFRQFHGRFYRPNNATLVLSGNFDDDEAMALIQQEFGTIPAGPAIERPTIEVPLLQQQLRRTITAVVPFPSVYIGFQGTPIGHPDSAAIDVVSLILGHGRSSRLQRSLVYQQQIAQNIMVFDYDQEKSGLFIVQAIAAQGVTADAVEQAIWEQIESIAQNGVSIDELAAALNYMETVLVRSLSHVSGVAGMLARYHVLLGDASRINTTLDEYRAVTLDAVQRVAQQFLHRNVAAVLHYVPETSEA